MGLPEQRLAVGAPPAVLTCGTRRNHEGNQVFGAGMRGTSAGRLMPCRELAFARRGIRVGHRVIQPAIEVCRGTQSARITTVEVAQIVIAHTAANNQNTLIAQRRQGAAQTQVSRRIQITIQRHLHHRNVRVRIDELERNEDAVIETSLGFLVRRNVCRGEQLPHAPCERWITRNGISEAIRVLRKAVVIE